MKDGYNTIVGETALSSQVVKTKISIVAILKNSSIVLLDEATQL